MSTKLLIVRLLTAVILDGIQYACNSLVRMNEKKAKELIDSGCADCNKDAVAFVKAELSKTVIDHKPATQSAPVDSVVDDDNDEVGGDDRRPPADGTPPGAE